MELNDYQALAHRTAVYPTKEPNGALYYTALGLTGEAGEVANKVKKIYRGDFPPGTSAGKIREDIVKELGDVLWYVAEMSSVLGVSLDEVAKINVAKLQARQSLGSIQGAGDDR
jgi:NTP pyrophosphatase (non-canonical NTP hydrolase)